MLLAQNVVAPFTRVLVPAPLSCCKEGYGIQHARQEALEAAVQTNPGLRSQAAGIEVGVNDDPDRRSRGLWQA